MSGYAIAASGEMVSPHFGRCEGYEIVEVGPEGELVAKSYLESPGHEPSVLPQLLADHRVECILAGGVGPRAAGLLDELGIKTVSGVGGRIEDVVAALLAGTLSAGDDLCGHRSV